MLKKLLSVIPILLPFLLAAQINIKGRVIDANNAAPLAGAHVSINNNLKTAITKPDGLFEINGLEKGKYRIKITFIGYADWSGDFELVESRTMMINMEPISYTLSEDVIIQATRASEKAPITASVLSRDQILQKNQGKDIPFFLEHLPAVVTTSDAGTGIGYSSFRIRGTDMNRINITVNGIPLNDAESHGVFWVNMPDFASSVSSLQVQRGVGTSTNGAAAFGASVNLQTAAPSSQPYGEIANSAGSFNTFKHSVGAGTGLINGKWAVDARLSKISSDGYIDRASSDLKSFYVSSGYYGVNTIVKLNIFSGTEKTYQAWDGVPSDILPNNRTYNGVGYYKDLFGNEKYYDNETDNYQQDHYQIMMAHRFNVKSIVNLAVHYTRGRGYYEQYKDNKKLSSYGLTPLIVGTDTIDTYTGRTDLIRRKHLDNHFYGYTASYNYQPTNRLQLTFGNSGNIYDGDHFGRIIWVERSILPEPQYEWYRGNGTKKDVNVFAKAMYQATSRLNLYGDVQLRGINYAITGIDDDLRDIAQEHDFLFFNPKAGIYYDLHSNGSIYTSIAVASREPNRDNYTDASASQDEPKAERLYDYELGYHYSNGAISWNVNGYYMYYKDQLILTGEINDVGSAVMTNVDRSYRTGLEASALYKISNDFNVSANAAFSKNKIINFIEKVENWNTGEYNINYLDKTDLAFSPSVIAGAEITWFPAKGFSATFDGKYVSKQYIDNTSSEDRKLDPYIVNNLRLAYSVKPKFLNELQFNFAVNNIFNHEYETNAWVSRYYLDGEYQKYDGYFPQAGINFMGGLIIKL